WNGALAHLDAGCPDCRESALRADPLLAFRRLPELELSAAEEAAEVEAMQGAVAALLRARSLERGAETDRSPGILRFPGRRFEGINLRFEGIKLRRWAAAAVLALLSLSVGPWKGPAARPGGLLRASSAALDGTAPSGAVKAVRMDDSSTLEGV